VDVEMKFPHLIVFLLPGSAVAGPTNLYVPFPTAEELLQRASGRPYTITVEGNVGAGKSTLLSYFEKYPNMNVHKEPLDVWQNLNGTDFLGLAYANPQRWGMTFESLVTTFCQIVFSFSLPARSPSPWLRSTWPTP